MRLRWRSLGRMRLSWKPYWMRTLITKAGSLLTGLLLESPAQLRHILLCNLYCRWGEHLFFPTPILLCLSTPKCSASEAGSLSAQSVENRI